MKRGLLVLVLGLLVGVGTHVACFRLTRPADPDTLDGQLAWMKTELGLRDDQFARIKELHRESSPKLRALAAQVAQMQAEFAAFENTRKTSDKVDFIEFARFVDARQRVNRECLESTRQLVMATANTMNPVQREHYLGIVAVSAPSSVYGNN